MSGMAVRYLAGGAWSRSGDITTADQWNAYVAAAAQRLANPVKVQIMEKK